MTEKWTIHLTIARGSPSEKRRDQTFTLEVNPDEYVLDVVERVWAHHDRSLCFRHACHHSTCGACGMLVNGVEKLTCITPLRSVVKDGGHLRVDPLRNFPVVADLVVDMGDFYRKMQSVGFSQVAGNADARLPYEEPPDQAEAERLVDCIECGLCISACPPAATSEGYLGPAVLAAIQHDYAKSGELRLLTCADSANGAWRCHSAFECSAVCPSNVDPAHRIMTLRRSIISFKFQQLFGRKSDRSTDDVS